MYRFRTPTDIRQTHNATIAGTIDCGRLEVISYLSLPKPMT